MSTRHRDYGAPDRPQRIRESFARQGAMALVGATLDRVEPGYCAISLAPRPEISQQHGYVHAGARLARRQKKAGGVSLLIVRLKCVEAQMFADPLGPQAADGVLEWGRLCAVVRIEAAERQRDAVDQLMMWQRSDRSDRCAIWNVFGTSTGERLAPERLGLQLQNREPRHVLAKQRR